MKLKTLNDNPSLFFDIRALVEKVANPFYVLDCEGIDITKTEKGKIAIIDRREILSVEARTIIEKWKKLER